MKLSREQLREGIECHCCGRWAKMYKRTLNSSMANFLIHFKMYVDKHNPIDGWVHVWKKLVLPKDAKICTEYAKLRFWGLLECKDITAKKSRSDEGGYWRITSKGESFVEGKLRLPKYVYLFNDKECGFDGELITINEVSKFNKEEIINENYTSDSVSEQTSGEYVSPESDRLSSFFSWD